MTEHGEHHGEPEHQGADDPYAPRPVAGWYMIAAVGALLFMSFGCVLYLMHMLADPATMPLDQRAAYEAEPAWVIGAYALSMWVGLAGAVLLVLKRRLAEPFLAISIVAALAWLGGSVGVTKLRETMSATDLLVVIVMVALTWTIFWFARHSRQRGWIN